MLVYIILGIIIHAFFVRVERSSCFLANALMKLTTTKSNCSFIKNDEAAISTILESVKEANFLNKLNTEIKASITEFLFRQRKVIRVHKLSNKWGNDSYDYLSAGSGYIFRSNKQSRSAGI